jgi:arginyl-tRNA synthetase
MIIVDRKVLAEYLSQHISHLNVDEIGSIIEVPSQNINYTYAFPCYKLAKHEKKAPNLIAEELYKKLVLPDFIDKVEAVGPYLNFRIKSELILKNIYEIQEKFGIIRETAQLDFHPERIVIEYPSPNTNKPLHLGHLRNMLIGKMLSNLLKYKGHQVFQVNLNNDRGVHICKSMWAYMKWGNNKKPDKKTDHFVGDFYVLYSKEESRLEAPAKKLINELDKETKKNKDKQDLEKIKELTNEIDLILTESGYKDLLNEIQGMLAEWEANNPEIRNLWQKMNNWALKGFKETFQKSGIEFDKEYNESDIYLSGKKIIIDGLKKGIFSTTDDGAIIARLKAKYDLDDKIVLRSDGTSIYITQDIALAYLKKKDFNYSKSIYVVADEQNDHFKRLFAILDLLSFKEDNYHLSYGMINIPEGRMKSREGTTVDVDDFVEKMQKLAYEEVSQRYPDLTEDEKLRRSNIIGMSAIRFFILKIAPKTSFVFNPRESLSFEGETGPYIQYVYARIQSIFEKSNIPVDDKVDYKLLNHEKELDLIKQLNYFPEILEQTVKTYGLHLIPQYLLTLCQAFNSFYSACIVISENKELEKARLLLIKCVQIVIKTGLSLLGIETLDKM